MSKTGTFVSVAEDQEGKSPRIVTETEPFPISLFDGLGNPIGSLSGALNVHDADVHNSIVNQYLHQHSGISTTITTDVPGDGSVYQIDVADSTGFIVGDYLHFNTGNYETTHPVITAISQPTGPATFTLDRRLDQAHPIGSTVESAIVDMAVGGTIASPQEFWVAPVAGEVWHITRILFAMAHSSAGDLGLFGNLPSLANGVLIRVKLNGQYSTLTNWKENGDMKVDMFDVDFDPRSGGQGSYSTSGRGTFKNAGAVLRLDGNTGDRLELYVQDSLVGLGFFKMKAQGHLEDG